jgi:hypothetical protein
MTCADTSTIKTYSCRVGADNIAKTIRAIRDDPRRALPILGITNDPGTHGT